jgi:hypothetical protein
VSIAPRAPSADAGDDFVSSDAPPKRAGVGRKALSSSVDDISSSGA